VLLVLELGISEEIVASLCVLGALVWGVFLLVAPAHDRRIFWSIAGEIVAGCALACVIASPFLYYLIIGINRVPGAINSATVFSADPVNFVIPTQVTRFGYDIMPGIAAKMLGGASEQGGYLGIVLILILALYAWEMRRNPYARGLLWSIGVLILCSFGPWLHLDGTLTPIPLPWILPTHLPLIKSALPIRFTMYISLATAIAAGCWIAAGTGRGRIMRLALGTAAYLCLLPNPPLYNWSDMPNAGLFHDPGWRSILPRNANIVILPFGQNGPDMSWQLDARMKFTQSGGYVGYPPLNEWAEPVVRDFFAGTVDGNFADELLAYNRSHKLDAIIIAPGTPLPLATAIHKMGWPTVTMDGDEIISVPRG
jgi:hypothetical protein